MFGEGGCGVTRLIEDFKILGLPLWDLTLCLLASWAIIFIIVAKSVKSSGKAAYFLALFPYVVLFILLIRSESSSVFRNSNKTYQLEITRY